LIDLFAHEYSWTQYEILKQTLFQTRCRSEQIRKRRADEQTGWAYLIRIANNGDKNGFRKLLNSYEGASADVSSKPLTKSSELKGFNRKTE